MIYNPFMPTTRFNSYIARGGGGEGAAPAPVKTAEEIAAEEAAAAKAAEEAAEAARLKAIEDAKAAASASELAAAQAKELAEAGETAEQRQARLDSEAAQAQAKATSQGAADMMTKSTTDPASLVKTAEVANIDASAPGTSIATGTGAIGAPEAISGAPAASAATVDPTKVADQVSGVTGGVEAAQGTVSTDATALAAQKDSGTLSQLELEAAQIAQAQVVSPAAARTLQTGEMISGSAVDMAEVDAALQVEAAQADPTARATVRGQLSELMQDFQSTEPPAWAAGALRNATAAMAARGLGASSMAGQALVQAAMESAIPIAMTDAQTFAKFESQNLSNRQQTAMFAAEQRANFLGMKFTQDFQTKVANAAKVSDIANMNFTAEQQVALENARIAQSVDLANLSAANAKVMADAAAMSNMDMANLNNRQQAAVMNAQAFLAMDMKNMDLEQQTNMFKAQKNIDAIFSDQAATNAASQFNAVSENQTNQFFANMANQVQQFNAGMALDASKFNAENALVIAQANAQWRQNTSTINTAAQNEANRAAALTANNITQGTLDTIWQRERDIMDYAFRQAESAEDRALSVFLADKSLTAKQASEAAAAKAADKQAKGYLFTKLLFG